MGIFKCSACGHSYSSADNFAPCPVCCGAGKPDENCTCRHCCNIAGQRMWRISTNPDCPIHGESTGTKDKDKEDACHE